MLHCSICKIQGKVMYTRLCFSQLLGVKRRQHRKHESSYNKAKHWLKLIVSGSGTPREGCAWDIIYTVVPITPPMLFDDEKVRKCWSQMLCTCRRWYVQYKARTSKTMLWGVIATQTPIHLPQRPILPCNSLVCPRHQRYQYRTCICIQRRSP